MTETRPTDRRLPEETQSMTVAESALADRPGQALAAAYKESYVAILAARWSQRRPPVNGDPRLPGLDWAGPRRPHDRGRG